MFFSLGNFTSLESPMRTSSRLSKTLKEILHDKDALGYFIQFMESKKAGQYIRFWLDAESFQASTWSRIRTHSFNLSRKNSMKRQNHSDTQLADSKTTTIPEHSEEENLSVSSQNVARDSESGDTLVESDQKPITTASDLGPDSNRPSIHDTGQNIDTRQGLSSNISENVNSQSKLSAVISHDNGRTGVSGLMTSKSSASSEDLSNTTNVTEKSELWGQKQNKSGVKQDDSVSEKLKQSKYTCMWLTSSFKRNNGYYHHMSPKQSGVGDKVMTPFLLPTFCLTLFSKTIEYIIIKLHSNNLWME